ncbi:lipocalin family protein [Phocaeicola sp.]|uniref:lipocalin family protein n=1 Tax=Phocaeicola sp. TaxID=2773926 RepID=UPI003AB29EF2
MILGPLIICIFIFILYLNFFYLCREEYPEDDEAWSHAPKDECEYFGNFTFREDGTYSEYDLDGTSNPQSIEKWEVNGNVITLIEDEYEQYDLKVLEISSNKLVLEFHDKDETSEHYAKMTYKRG